MFSYLGNASLSYRFLSEHESIRDAILGLSIGEGTNLLVMKTSLKKRSASLRAASPSITLGVTAMSLICKLRPQSGVGPCLLFLRRPVETTQNPSYSSIVAHIGRATRSVGQQTPGCNEKWCQSAAR